MCVFVPIYCAPLSTLPLKQGLKQLSTKEGLPRPNASLNTSIKTRIETPHPSRLRGRGGPLSTLPLKQGLKPIMGGARFLPPLWPLSTLPLKQGLKHYISKLCASDIKSSLNTSIKTRIETTGSTSAAAPGMRLSQHFH